MCQQHSVLFWLCCASWHCFLIRLLLVCSESVVLHILRLLLWEIAVMLGSFCQPYTMLLDRAWFSARSFSFSPFLSLAMSSSSEIWNHCNGKRCRSHSTSPPCDSLPATTATNAQWYNSVQVWTNSENMRKVLFRKLSLFLMRSLRASCALHQLSQQFTSVPPPLLETFVTMDYFIQSCCMQNVEC